MTHAQVPSSFFSEVAQLSAHFGDWAIENILELSWLGQEDLDDVAQQDHGWEPALGIAINNAKEPKQLTN